MDCEDCEKDNRINSRTVIKVENKINERSKWVLYACESPLQVHPHYDDSVPTGDDGGGFPSPSSSKKARDLQESVVVTNSDVGHNSEARCNEV